MKPFLTFGKPDIGKEEIDAVIKTMESGWLSTGPKVQELEVEFKKYINCKYAIPVSSCTAALHLALHCHNIGVGDEVITTPMTFVATINAIEHCGAKPVFVDTKEGSYNIDASKIANAITSRTKAILPVHLLGMPCDMEEINKAAKEYGMFVIEDAAHSIGAKYKNRRVGSNGTACFSFYATKNVCGGEGGMIATDNKIVAESARILSNHGMSKDAWMRYRKKGKKTYQVVEPGFKYNMQDLNAAIALEQLKKINKFNKLRRKYAELYFEELANCKLIDLPEVEDKYRRSVWHLFPIRLKLNKLSINRFEFMEQLEKAGVGCGVHYEAIHLHPYYRNKYKEVRELRNAEDISKRTVSIPLQTSMTEQDLMNVVETVKKLLKRYKK